MVLHNTKSLLKLDAQVMLSSCMPLFRCKAVQSRSLCMLLHNTKSLLKHDAQVMLSACMPLFRCKAVQSRSLCMVLHNTTSLKKHVAQVDLSGCMPLFRCKAVQSRSLGMVLHNTKSNIMTLTNHKLPKAASRRSTLPSKSKTSFHIFHNSNAVNVATAECTLAVRTAQHRTSRRRCKRSLCILGHVWSAFKQQARQIRV
jgi:hypothetical protein